MSIFGLGGGVVIPIHVLNEWSKCLPVLERIRGYMGHCRRPSTFDLDVVNCGVGKRLYLDLYGKLGDWLMCRVLYDSGCHLYGVYSYRWEACIFGMLLFAHVDFRRFSVCLACACLV